MIKVSNVIKDFGAIRALDSLSLEISDGIIFGLLGVNGAGKTTLLSILNGLIQIDSGEIEVFGLDIKKDIKEIKKISSIIPQNLAFYEKLSVKENIDFFASIQKSTQKSINTAIEINSLGDLLSQNAATLSGGQKRRLNIAIGLLNDPKILYLDEPTVGIDPKNRNEILDLIQSYKDLGICVVYTSHYMNEIEKICDSVAIIDKGKLIVQDNLENLLYGETTDKISVEVVYADKLNILNLQLTDKSTIQTNKQTLPSLLETLYTNNIRIKQVKFGTTNLEKYFLEATN